MNIKQTAARWWPSALVILVIIYATIFPDPAGADELPPIPYLDKIIHAVMFGGMAGALAFDYQRARRRHNVLTPRVMTVICAVCIASGALIEVIQEQMHIGRSGDSLDFLADTVGVVVAYFAAPPAIRKVLRIR